MSKTKAAKPKAVLKTYKDIFDSTPVAIIILDYSPLFQLFQQIRKDKVSDIRNFLGRNPALVRKTFEKTRICESNKAALQIYGSKSEKELLVSLKRTLTTKAIDVLIEQFVSLLEGNSSFEGEFKYRSPARILQDVFISVSVPAGSKKDFSRVVVTLQDITTWKKIERNLRKKAQLDGLTKLLNQHAVMERMEHELIRAKRYGLSLSCMMIDLDFFKVINDKFGHQRGDQILRRVAKMIHNCFRKVDIVGRYGGDEFLVILPETKTQNAKYAAMRLQKIFASTLFKYRKIISFHITLSIGIAGYPVKNLKDAKDLISLADKAMYSCKMAGRNRIEIAK